MDSNYGVIDDIYPLGDPPAQDISLVVQLSYLQR